MENLTEGQTIMLIKVTGIGPNGRLCLILGMTSLSLQSVSQLIAAEAYGIRVSQCMCADDISDREIICCGRNAD